MGTGSTPQSSLPFCPCSCSLHLRPTFTQATRLFTGKSRNRTAEQLEPVTADPTTLPPGIRPDESDYYDDEDPTMPAITYDRLPLPVVGNYGWWFISFAPDSFFTTILGIALLYVPCLILLTTMTGSSGSFSVAFRRDYGPLMTCALMAWAAAHLPFILAGMALTYRGFGPRSALLLLALSAVCFGWIMSFGVRTLFGTSLKKAIGLVCLAAFSFSIQAKLFGAVPLFLFSPCLLYYAYSRFRGDIGDIGSSLRRRRGFRRSMEAATINPRDASAHYQLGLVFQSRRQYTEAITHFRQAVAIDNEETDAHFQLGRLAREQGRLQDAIDHFGNVLSQDDKHARSEIWREVGVTYLDAKMFAEARDALATFVERRSYDPEGLYYYGKTLEHLDDPLASSRDFSTLYRSGQDNASLSAWGPQMVQTRQRTIDCATTQCGLNRNQRGIRSVPKRGSVGSTVSQTTMRGDESFAHT